ncbi:MAG TPA: R3H domain-containing nucleic acid-binding protein [Patescibacteria group bacterium]|nr:R3H domain-containing nucleic acid-binding protein [Patescibacteria group bacterium]
MENKNENLKRIVGEMMEKMGFEVDIEIKTPEEGQEAWEANIKTQDSSFLIGQYGVNLQSLQHIARLIVRKNIPEATNFVIDVNSYRQEKNESVVKMAQNLANEALLEKRAIVMRPMSPYERRIVHMELAKNDQIKTESIGEGDDRRVVIKPANLI